jgi:cobalt/nickel transport system permease protein
LSVIPEVYSRGAAMATRRRPVSAACFIGIEVVVASLLQLNYPLDRSEKRRGPEMHIAEGILPLSHALGWAALASPIVVISARRVARLLREGDGAERALLGMAGALTFAVTLFPVPVPVAGVTSHLCATPVLALLLGPRRMVLPAALTLLLQAILFAHGGLTSLGANVLTLGVVGPLVGYGLTRGLRALAVPAAWAVGIACALADVAVYVADAGILGLALAGERPFGVWFTVVLAGFAPAQVPLAILEGVVSALLIRALVRRRPALVPAWLRPATRAPSIAPIIAAAALVLFTSSAASAAPSEPFHGVDETVIEATAARAGHPAARPLLDLGEGEVSLFVWTFGTFIAGWAAGWAWGRIGQLSVDEERLRAVTDAERHAPRS